MKARELYNLSVVRKIKTKIIISFFIIFFATVQTLLSQQIIIQLFQSPAQFSIHDLSEAVFLNQGNSAITVGIKFSVVTDINQPIISIAIKEFLLQPGANFVAEHSIMASSITYGTIDAALQFRQTGILSFGKYLVCAQVISIASSTILAHTCNEQVSVVYSPPQLIYPSDGEEIDNPYPPLIWISPQPDTKNQVTYDLKLVEMHAGQGPYDAMQNNYAYYKVKGYGDESLNYPLDAPSLIIDKWYAWKVTATYKGTEVGETEVWKFKVKQEQQESIIKTRANAYPVINYNLQGRNFDYKDKLYFAYNNDYRETELKYKIIEYASLKEYDGKEKVIVKPGNNLCVIDISDKGFFKNDARYVLEVSDEKQNVFRLQFEIK